MGNRTQREQAELYEKYKKEFSDFHRPIVFEMDIALAMCVVSGVQLALRHPAMKGTGKHPSSEVMRRWVIDFKDSIPPEFPAIKKVIEMGFHQRYDEGDMH